VARYRKPKDKGRQSPNLKRAGDMLINQHGIQFTEAEKRQLVSLVNSANRKRRNMLKNEHALTALFGGDTLPQFRTKEQEKAALQKQKKTIGDTVAKMGKESDFILVAKTKSLQRYETKEDFNRYIGYLQKVVDKDYIPKRAELYRDNKIKAMRNVYGDDAEPIIKLIKDMSIKQFMEAVQSTEILEIQYDYDKQRRDFKLRQIRSLFNLKDKYQPDGNEDYDEDEEY
jgi:hypothetical protein